MQPDEGAISEGYEPAFGLIRITHVDCWYGTSWNSDQGCVKGFPPFSARRPKENLYVCSTASKRNPPIPRASGPAVGLLQILQALQDGERGLPQEIVLLLFFGARISSTDGGLCPPFFMASHSMRYTFKSLAG